MVEYDIEVLKAEIDRLTKVAARIIHSGSIKDWVIHRVNSLMIHAASLSNHLFEYADDIFVDECDEHGEE